MRISDWSSDVCSSDLNAAVACPGVKFAAVVGVFHPKWEERPILIVETHEDSTVTAEAMLAHLAPHMPRWWLPDVIIFETVPLTATGKIDKKVLRERHARRLVHDGAAALPASMPRKEH